MRPLGRWALAGVSVLAVVGVLLLDVVVAPPGTPPIPLVPTGPADPVAGGAVCTVGVGGLDSVVDVDGIEELVGPAEDPGAGGDDDATAGDPASDGDEDGASDEDGDAGQPDAEGTPEGETGPTTVVLARPGGSGDGPATTRLRRFVGGDVELISLGEVFPGSDLRHRVVGSSEPMGARIAWRHGPVAVTREWAVTSETLDALLAGGCATTSGQRLVVPGLSTAEGADARLRLANPFEASASVAVRFVTPTGSEQPTALRNVSVPARTVREITVNELLPEQRDLAAVVEVVSGRLAVEGSQLVGPAGAGGPSATLLEARPVGADDVHEPRAWTVPWLPQGEEASSWLWVANLGDRTAAVELSVHTADGAAPAEGLAEASVPAGTLRRIDLQGSWPDEIDAAAVTVRTEDPDVVVSSGSSLSSAAAAGHGRPVQLAKGADAVWVLSGGAPEGRAEELRIANPGSRAAVVDVKVFNGVAVLRPEELQGIEVPPGAIRTRALGEVLGSGTGWTAVVTASEGEVVVGRLGHDTGQGPSRLVAVPGVSSATWQVEHAGLVTDRVDGLTQRLGGRGDPTG